MSRLFTPRRLRDNEEFMWHLADRQLDTFVTDGTCEFIGEYSEPFAIEVIADLLGVPKRTARRFPAMLATVSSTGTIDDEHRVHVNPMAFLEDAFRRYVEDRRREPRDDVLTKLAVAKFADGSMPEVIEVVREATFLFVAGQETPPGSSAPRCSTSANTRTSSSSSATDVTSSRASSRRCSGGEPGEEPLPHGAT